MPKIEKLIGREILDSRGNPTVLAKCVLEGGIYASASVPSGASTGAAEAHELRDGDPNRYKGRGCRQAAANVNGPLNNRLAGQNFEVQADLDREMISLDGTPTKSAIGANAILAVSVAFARAHAKRRRESLYQHFANFMGFEPHTIPQLTINLFSGGKHAGQQVSIQDVLIVPLSSRTVDEALVMAFDVYSAAARIIFRKYGMRPLTADEGGLSPPCRTSEEMLALAVQSIEEAGFVPGQDVALGVDVASTHFYKDRFYEMDSERLTSEAMIALLDRWVKYYPIITLEDGLAENDWESWPILLKKMTGRAILLADDLLCTNAARIQRAIDSKACDALLLKVNQVGTLTEAGEALRLAREAAWSVTLSVRSGETEDNWAADLAVGWRVDQFKNGSIRQSERLSKYNRLLDIAEQTHWELAKWPRPIAP